VNDKFVALIVEPLAGMVRRGRRLLQDGVGGDHLAGNQILADAEMLERALGLRPPELVRRHLDDAEAVGLLSHAGHVISPYVRVSVGRDAGQTATSTTAWAKACGASCGRLWPTPPVMSRCAYWPENFPA